MAELDLGAVRAFVAVADNRHFGDAAVDMGITQQAVSKRVAKLESDLGAVLLARHRSGTHLTPDGEVFLPHARALLATADRATRSLRNGRPLRVDVLDTRLMGAELIRDFYATTTGLSVDVVTSNGLRAARATLKAGTVDAAFARVTSPLADDGLASIPAFLEPAVVLVGARHPLAGRKRVTMTELAGATAWMPGNAPNSEWADFWDAAGAAFGMRIDTTGPDFGYEHFVREIGTTTDRIGFIGERCQVPTHPGVVRLAVAPPRPAYPWSLLWHRRNPHTALPRLITHVRTRFRPYNPAEVWLPTADREFLRR
ncbi:LysR family transcriptional regulator [Actinokineospora auranticolor]|uniref:DNA-binding transcriptional LysR family regulator n=1 Tax=Actinokineospora auranticolor TaxID=155976 RepID=A0A2S6H0W2_9PSEU|nr:LysR family transcriptional regulator [Actinokineospora auranticolor]PPK71118.1 DNA-binding transcriptional LysR family regulator [Actinokineospora auranticolor]